MVKTDTSKKESKFSRFVRKYLNPEILQLKGTKVDTPFLIAVILILVVGLFMLLSSGYAAALLKKNDSYYYIKRQLIYAVVGVIGMAFASVAPSVFKRKHYNFLILAAYTISLILLVIVLIVSKDTEKRWLYIGFQFQPSEVAKISIILMVALYFSAYKDKIRERNIVYGIIIPCFLVVPPAFLIFIEPHLSGAILVIAIGYVMFFVGGCNKGMAVAGIVIVLAVFAVLYFSIINGNYLFLKKYQAERFLVWQNPAEYKYDQGFQPYQSLLTIGSGGAFGLGYGKSRQKYLFLPEPQNDFIFSVVSEEVGFVGVLLIMLLFVFLVWRGLYIGIRARNTFESMLVIGIVSKVAIQTVLNFAVVSNTLPTTGISLPFFSYGGTALIVQLAEMGLVLHASRFAYLDKGKDEKSK